MSKYDRTNGVTFGNIHTYRDLGALLKHKGISNAVPQTVTIDIPGRDGQEDITENVYGTVIRYKAREIIVELRFLDTGKNGLSIYSKINNRLNGKRMEVRFDDDDAYHWEGRVYVGDMTDNGYYVDIPVTVIVNPYKYCDDSMASKAWLWDDLDFENGIILDLHYTVTDKETIIVTNPYAPNNITMSADKEARITYYNAYGKVVHETIGTEPKRLPEFRSGRSSVIVETSGTCNIYLVYGERKSL